VGCFENENVFSFWSGSCDDDAVPLLDASLTDVQRARRERMLDVAGELASVGGYDAVQMRSVASGAEVALGTLYRYFPSKEHLLVSVMLCQVESLSDRLTVRPTAGVSAAERVNEVLGRATAALLRQPDFTTALMRALVSGDKSVVPAVRQVREAMHAIVLDAMGSGSTDDGGSTDQMGDGEDGVADDVLLADLLEEIWFSSLLGWISGVYPSSSIGVKLTAATQLLLDR